jgi:N-acetylglucosaminyldiphosphoundecaprenol N-acetyl-beta-D-mannosaminyltransferase
MPEILGVRIDASSKQDASNLAINTDKQIYFCTPNPEIILEAQKNPKFLKTLNHSALNTADGIGILWASKYLKISEGKSKPIKTIKWILSLASILFHPSYIKSEIKQRITGVELTKEICKQAAEKGKKIFLLGASREVVQLTKEKLEDKNRNIKIVGTSSGSAKEQADEENIKQINDSQAEILFVAFGAPKQELWIERNLKKLKTVQCAIGVGGTFDFIAGKVKRAPEFMRKFGLEWLYRLAIQPSRLMRIINATIKFPLTVLRYSLKKR